MAQKYLYEKPFKDRRCFNQRKRESESISAKYPDKVPLIIERYKSEKALPVLEKMKYLVPSDMTVGMLSNVIRKRLQLNSSQSLFLLINSRNICSSSLTLLDVYREEKDEDGFLYIVYASQEVFGSYINF
ncbi:microtubule-associated proteins 1A/1B light chain 3A isoform X2 [Hydra vulgaris]|uniref:microtubule-associated proteins 1A/1B light chain 3A isoform X2 n=1 Tax=Hydra vulgaris TaxID=6087 RepID=UPI0006411415|nr:microtubule-associated proteins 1A/1B light chain 3A [Hydra vulgaris]